MEYEGRGKNLERSGVSCSLKKRESKKRTSHVTGRSFRKVIKVTYSKDRFDILPTGGEGAKKLSEDKSIGKPEHRKYWYSQYK